MAVRLNDDNPEYGSGIPRPGRLLLGVLLFAMFGTLAYFKFFATHERPLAAEAAYPIVRTRAQPIVAPVEPPQPVKVDPPKPQAQRPLPRTPPPQKAEKSEWRKMIEKKRIEGAWAGPLVSGDKQTVSNRTNGNGNHYAQHEQNGNRHLLEIPSRRVGNGNGNGNETQQANVWNTPFDERGQGQVGVLQRFSSPFVIRRGWMIEAQMEVPINTDSPGQVTAIVLKDVMDSVTGRHVLIPAGSQLVGAYDSRTRYGQERIALAWDLINFPNRTYMPIPAMPGADQAGVAGVPGEVNNHLWATAGRSALLTITGAASRMATRGAYGGGDFDPTDALAAEGGRELRRGSQQAFGRGFNRPPTVTTEAGEIITVQVTRPLVFPHEYRDEEDEGVEVAYMD